MPCCSTLILTIIVDVLSIVATPCDEVGYDETRWYMATQQPDVTSGQELTVT